MWEYTVVFRLFSIVVLGPIVRVHANNKPIVDWWCDDIECFYSDTIPKEDKCDGNHSIPYRFNYTTGACELNLKGLLLSFQVLNNRLAAVVEKKNRKRNEIIFQVIIKSGNIFAGFASVCVFIGCLYCCWMQYSDRQLRKSVKKLAKHILTLQKSNKTKQNTGKKGNNQIETTDKFETVAHEFEVSVV